MKFAKFIGMTMVVFAASVQIAWAANVAGIGDTEYETLQAAVDAAVAGDTVKLISGIELTEMVVVAEDDNITLDLNGCAITVPAADASHIYALNNKGVLTIKDSVGGGSITARGIYNGYNGSDVGVAVAGAKMIIESGKFVALDSDGGAAVFNCAELVINGGSFVGSVAALNVRTMGIATINGGTFSGGNNGYTIQTRGNTTIKETTVDKGFGAIAVYGGTLAVNGGTYSITEDMNTTHHLVYIAAGSVALNGGEFTFDSASANAMGSDVLSVGSKGELTVNGGVFNAPQGALCYKSTVMTIKGGTFKNAAKKVFQTTEDIAKNIAPGYGALKDLDGNYVVGAIPTATVNDLGGMIVKGGDYYTLGGGSTSADMPLNFVMQFLANQTAEDMKSSPYADWYGDFVITFSGLEEGGFVADNCYLAGYYGDFGWWKIPVDGMRVENGARFPVMLGYGAGQKYDYICSDVRDFRCAMYLTPEVLAAHPNLKVNLELSVVDNSKGQDAALEAMADESLEFVNVVGDTEYSAEKFLPDVVKIGDIGYKTLEEAIAAMQPGDTVKAIANIELDETLVIDKAGTFDFSDMTITNKVADAAAISVTADGVTIIGGTLIASGDGIVAAEGASAVIESGIYEVAGIALSGAVLATGGTFDKDVSANVAPGYSALKNLDSKYIVGKSPTATVNDLGGMIVKGGDYYTLGGGSTSADMPLNFVMQFLADQTAEDMKSSPYADWYGDFVITFSGLEEGGFVADNCYLAGYYGDFGWWKIPVDGMRVENGARFPVMLGYGAGQKYDYICSDVRDFRCAMYLTDAILAAHPNLKVNLELSVVDNSKGQDAALEAMADESLEFVNVVGDTDYSAEDFLPDVAKIGGEGYKTLEAAITAMQPGDTVKVIADIELDETLVIDKAGTIDFTGKTVTSKVTGAAAVSVTASGVTFTGGTLVASGDGIVVAEGASAEIMRGVYEVAGVALSGAVTATGGTFNQDVNAFAADGYEALADQPEEGWWKIMPYVAEFEGEKFASIQSAIIAANSIVGMDGLKVVNLIGSSTENVSLSEGVVIKTNGNTTGEVTDDRDGSTIVEVVDGSYNVDVVPAQPSIRRVMKNDSSVELRFVWRASMSDVTVLQSADLKTWTEMEAPSIVNNVAGQECVVTVEKPAGGRAFFKLNIATAAE